MSRRSGSARLLVAIWLVVVVGLVGGCFSGESADSTPAPTATDMAYESPSAAATADLLPTAGVTDPGATTTPPVAATAAPTPTVWLPGWSPLPPTVLIPVATPAAPPPTAAPPTAAPPTAESTPAPPRPSEPPDAALVAVRTGNSRPTRIVVAALHIDLPIIKSSSSYPKCNVAQYLTNFVNPGQPGTTYLYGHARRGMFLPLLTQSKINNGANMIGMLVKLYTADKKLHLYRINIVKRHATSYALAVNLSRGQHRLIMQTSEGPSG